MSSGILRLLLFNNYLLPRLKHDYDSKGNTAGNSCNPNKILQIFHFQFYGDLK